MGKKRGRPRELDSRSGGYRLRMSKEERFILENICRNEGMNKAEVLRKGLEIMYRLSKNAQLNGYPINQSLDEIINGYPLNEDNDYENY